MDEGKIIEILEELKRIDTPRSGEHSLNGARTLMKEIETSWDKITVLEAENERLKDWERTIIMAPGEARDICVQRFRESDFAKDVIGSWKEANAKLKEQAEKSYKNGWEEGYKDCKEVYEKPGLRP